jgi:HEPN domain-containing protein
VDEPTAWLRQATADWRAAEHLVDAADDEARCHAIAKWQQTVEKAIKAQIAAMRDAGILHTPVGFKHEVEHFISVLIRLPHAEDNRTIQQHLHGLLDQETRQGIRELDALVPRRPLSGNLPRRNTEYPFMMDAANWTFPAAANVFSADEIKRFRSLAYRVLERVGRIISAIRRRPK